MITEKEIKEVMDNLYKVKPEISQLLTETEAGEFIATFYNSENHRCKGKFIKKKEDIYKLWKEVSK